MPRFHPRRTCDAHSLIRSAPPNGYSPSALPIADEEWDRTFKTNIYAYFHLTKAVIFCH